MVDDELNLFHAASHAGEERLHGLRPDVLADRHVVILDIVGHQLDRGVHVVAGDATDELVDRFLGGGHRQGTDGGGGAQNQGTAWNQTKIGQVQ